jgi:hypothetical protein
MICRAGRDSVEVVEQRGAGEKAHEQGKDG